MKNVLIFGATSAIAEHAARRFAADGCRLYLVGRNAEKLSRIREDLKVRGAASVESEVADLDDTASHEALVSRAWDVLAGIDAALVAHGALGDQQKSQADFAAFEAGLRTNFTSAVSLLEKLAARMEGQKSGTLAAISSVAGDRGRESNYVYGSAKAALSTYLQGLRQRMHKHGVRVVTVKPGLIDTPMTSGMPKSALYASAQAAGGGVYAAMKSGRGVAYVPGWWRWIMLAVRAIPESVFKKLSL